MASPRSLIREILISSQYRSYIAEAFAAHDEQQTVCAAPVMIVDDIVVPVGGAVSCQACTKGAVSCQVCAKMVSAGE
jgi:hypothetical protein